MRAATLIRKGFCKHWLAITEDGQPCLPTDSGAVRWCAVGAIERATHELLPWPVGPYCDESPMLALVACVGRTVPGVTADNPYYSASDREWRDLVNFNNAPERSGEEVAVLIESAVCDSV